MNKGMGSRRKHGTKVARWVTRKEVKTLARKARSVSNRKAVTRSLETE